MARWGVFLAHDVNTLGQPIGLPVTLELPRPYPPRSSMSGQYCTVTPIEMAHAADLYAAFSEDAQNRIWTYLPNGPYADLAGFEAWVDGAIQSDDPLMYTILVDGQPLGHASYLRITPAAGAIEVGFINYAPRLQQTRAATEAMFLMMQQAFDGLGYRRYEWKCDALNAPSRAAAERLGFVYEGTFRQATVYKGRNRDTAWFAITNQDWPAVKAGFEAWLDPANFDETGRQIQSLSNLRIPV